MKEWVNRRLLLIIASTEYDPKPTKTEVTKCICTEKDVGRKLESNTER